MCKDSTDSSNVIIQDELIDVSKEWIEDTKMPNILRNNYFGREHHVRSIFGIFVANDRYLLLIGGDNKKEYDSTFCKIIYFDRDAMHRKWHIWKEWKPTYPNNANIARIYRGAATLGRKKNSSVVFATNPVASRDRFCKLRLRPNSIEWSIERLIWIAFEKNDNNLACHIQFLSKDVILYLLSFLRRIIWY